MDSIFGEWERVVDMVAAVFGVIVGYYLVSLLGKFLDQKNHTHAYRNALVTVPVLLAGRSLWKLTFGEKK